MVKKAIFYAAIKTTMPLTYGKKVSGFVFEKIAVWFG
jgi:hypothetical protein